MAMSNVLRHMSHDALGKSITMPGASTTLGRVGTAPAPGSRVASYGRDPQVMAILSYFYWENMGQTGATRVIYHFALLGASIGDDAFCSEHTARRVETVKPQ